ncbi:WD40 repeat-like protein [Mytilinidion resinicola]|uniref:WD40 repeat-like protein n=1 Tax=Mytilinidion resinicola TaxID=574789 RepID=A0A6A6YX78_9PEZI|nr:WD40 repeat-like protein [Mytilinidion resinicola]KAF2813380.1 WD40 repeat-like protein [Mytilinidion resinicola]
MESEQQQQNDQPASPTGLALNDAPLTEAEEKDIDELVNEPEEQEIDDMMIDAEEKEKDEMATEADEHEHETDEAIMEKSLDDFLKSFEDDEKNSEDDEKSLEDLLQSLSEEEEQTPTPIWLPRCVASTNVPDQAAQWKRKDGTYYITEPRLEYYNFKEAQWAPDGCAVIASDTTNNLRTYIPPPGILAETDVHNMSPFASFRAPESIYAFALWPGFDFYDRTTAKVLCSMRDQPLRLINAWGGPSAVSNGSYRLVTPNTEKWMTPHSLAWTQSWTHFVAGSDSTIAIFDVQRYGEPVKRHKTKNMTAKGVGTKGLVSSLSISTNRVLAFGTCNTRQVGLYSNEGNGHAITFFPVSGNHVNKTDGGGVTNVEWSPCSTYLYVAERQSDVVHVYDMRITARSLGYMEGRNAHTNQRLGISVASCANGHRVWGGGVDGVVRSWDNPHWSEGVVQPSCEMKAHNGPVTSALEDPSGQLLVTCSAESYRDSSDDEEGDEDDLPQVEAGMKLWVL